MPRYRRWGAWLIAFMLVAFMGYFVFAGAGQLLVSVNQLMADKNDSVRRKAAFALLALVPEGYAAR